MSFESGSGVTSESGVLRTFSATWYLWSLLSQLEGQVLVRFHRLQDKNQKSKTTHKLRSSLWADPERKVGWKSGISRQSASLQALTSTERSSLQGVPSKPEGGRGRKINMLKVLWLARQVLGLLTRT